MQFLDVISVNVWAILASLANLLLLRSEERRVGKEC